MCEDGSFVFANILIISTHSDYLCSHVVERQGIGERFAGRLDGEVVLVVSDGVPGKKLYSASDETTL